MAGEDINISFRERLYRSYYSIKYNTVPDPFDTINIDSRKVEYYLTEGSSNNIPYRYRDYQSLCSRHRLEKAKYPHVKCAGIIMAGDWDLYKKPYHRDTVYHAIQNLNSEEKFEKTEYYDNLILKSRMKNGSDYIEEQIEKVNNLYNSINKSGYNPSAYNINIRDHIGINIGRNGELIFNNKGHHRLAICNHFSLGNIPVLVVVRHAKWQAIRREVMQSEDINDLDSSTKEVLDHPDIPSSHLKNE